MFVTKSRFDKVQRQREVNANAYWELQRQYQALDSKYDALQAKWNILVRDINAKGGQDFLNKACGQFNDDELRSLLQLVHPDKHDGKESAHKLTQKINGLRV